MAEQPADAPGTAAAWAQVLRDLVSEVGAYGAVLVIAPTVPGDGAVEHPVRAIEIDEDGAEVNLCAEPLDRAPLSVAEVLGALEGLSHGQRTYSVFTASPYEQLPDGVEARQDAPVVDLVVNHDLRLLGFVGEGAAIDILGRSA